MTIVKSNHSLVFAILFGLVCIGQTSVSGFQCIDGDSCYSFTVAPGPNCTFGGVRIYCPASFPSNQYVCNLGTLISSVTAGDGTMSAVTTGTSVVIEATGSFGSKAITTSNSITSTGNLIVDGTTSLDFGAIITNGNGDVTLSGYVAPFGLKLPTGSGPSAEGIFFSNNPITSPFSGTPTFQILAHQPTASIITFMDDTRTAGSFIVGSTRSSIAQTGTIISGVVVTGSTGVITTVQSVLPAATATTFNVTNVYYTQSAQNIQLTVRYAGSTGMPYTFIYAIFPTLHMFTIGIYNMGAAVLDANMEIYFSIN